MIEVKPSNVKLNKRDLYNFEKELGFNLPNDYKKFLEINNGGAPEPNIVELHNEEINSFSITDFFGINNAKINDLKSQYETYKERIPRRNLPICRVDGGNIVCLNIDNEVISLWDHDIELMDSSALPIKSLIVVAKSFDGFLNIIKPYDHDDDIDDYEIEEVWIDPDFSKELKDDKD